MGEILEALQDACLERKISTAEEARAWVRENHPPV
jgi:hypothetical protein